MSAALKNVFQTSLFRSSICSLKHQAHLDSARSLSYLSCKGTSKFKLHHSESTREHRSFNIHTIGGVLLDKSQGFTDKRSAESFNSEKELSQFLTEEIDAEKKLQKGTVPNQVCGFNVKLEGSEVVLSKKVGDETIEVCFNINHTVDSEEGEVEASDTAPEMKSRPNFEVEISRDGKTLGFSCSMIPPPANIGSTPQDQEAYNDLFAIDEVVMYSGEWKDTNYSAGGDVLDGTLYDMFMDLLEDKGINNEFIEHLTDFSTKYEHSQYINMLENIQKFFGSK